MKRNEPSCIKTNSVLVFLFIFSFILCTSVSVAQSPINFSGVWMQDTIKSDDFYRSFEVKYTITQTLQSFKVKQTFVMKGSNESVDREYAYSLDGKITTTEQEGGKEKNTAQWSADNQILTTRSTKTYGNDDVGFTETYSLSDNGLVLTVQKSDIIQGTLSVKLVFNKKQ